MNTTPPSDAPDTPVEPSAPETGPEPAAEAPTEEPMLVLGGLDTPAAAPITDTPENRTACAECGAGQYDADDYCDACGAKATDPRDHEELTPAAWAAGVCDRGIRHRTNEDALAMAASPASDPAPGPRRAAIVVCDGVSTAQRSAQASRAAADAALEVLRSAESPDTDRLAQSLDAATDAAAQAVADLTGEVVDPNDNPFSTNPACTFVAAVLVDDVAVVGAVGDSRAYWFPDDGEPLRLTTDDSWAEEQVRMGTDRATAESGPQAHTITRWLGVDAPDHTPGKAALRLDAPGWLLVCSDGLWNYASEPAHLAEVLRDTLAALPADDTGALRLARALVEWANAQGGRDNITAAAARIDGRPSTATDPDHQEPHRA